MKKELNLDEYEEWQDLLEDACDLCTCGTGEVPELLFEVFSWCGEDMETRRTENDRGTYRSVEWELAAKVLDSAGLIEHGTGIGSPWLTPYGETVLTRIKQLQAVP